MPRQLKDFRTIHYYNDLWGAHVYLCIGNPKELVPYLKRRFKYDASNMWDQNCSGMAFKITVNQQRKGYGIFMPQYKGSIQDLVILSHQCIHVADDILTDRNVQHGDQDKEALTYTHDVLYRYFLEKLKNG